MMKKVLKFVLLFSLLISLSQCSNSNKSLPDNNDNEAINSESTNSLGSISSSKNKNDLKNDDKDNDKNNKKKEKTKKREDDKFSKKAEDYYGKWDVKKVEAYASNNEDSHERNNDILGKTIEFTKDKISYGGKDYDKPSYSTKQVSNEEFNKKYKKNLSDLQINDNCVEELRVGNSDKIGIGNEFFWKNSDTLIMIKNGDCYELKKR